MDMLVYQLRHGNIIVSRDQSAPIEALLTLPRHDARVYVYASSGPAPGRGYRPTTVAVVPAWRSTCLDLES
jgi:hypothetical protein